MTLTWTTLTLMPNDGRQWKLFTALRTGFSLFDTMSLPLRSPLLVGQRGHLTRVLFRVGSTGTATAAIPERSSSKENHSCLRECTCSASSS